MSSNATTTFQPEPQPEPELELKPKPEQSPAVRSKKVKQAAVEKPKKNVQKIPWTSLEKKLLTECWLDASEDPFRGAASQTGDSFWGKIVANYNAKADVARTKDQITGKWRLIKSDVAKFNTIYSGYDKDRSYGEDDCQVMEAARKGFFLETRKAFNMYDCWLLLKDKPKFLAPSNGVDVMGRSLGKRKSVATVDDSDEEREVEDVNLVDNISEHEVFGQQPSKTAGSSNAITSRSSSASETRAQLEKRINSEIELLEAKKAYFETMCVEAKKRTMYAAFQFLSSGILTEDERKFIKKAKAHVMKEYKQFVQPSDHEDGDHDNKI